MDYDSKDYDCIVKGLNSLNSDSSRASFVAAYEKHPFVKVEKAEGTKNGGNAFKTTINKTVTKDFVDYIENDTDTLNDLKSCFPKSSTDSFQAKDIAPISQDFNMPELTLYITQWGHKLTAIDIAYDDENSTVKGSFNLSFPESLDITAPKNSKKFSQFLKDIDIEQIIKQLTGQEDPDEEPEEIDPEDEE